MIEKYNVRTDLALEQKERFIVLTPFSVSIFTVVTHISDSSSYSSSNTTPCTST